MKLDAFCLRATGTKALSRTSNAEESKKEIAMQPEFSVSVSPNPAKTFFNLSVNSSDKINPVEVRIFGIDGKLLSRQKTSANSTLKIKAETWNSGLYFLEVIQAESRKVIKLVKTN